MLMRVKYAPGPFPHFIRMSIAELHGYEHSNKRKDVVVVKGLFKLKPIIAIQCISRMSKFGANAINTSSGKRKGRVGAHQLLWRKGNHSESEPVRRTSSKNNVTLAGNVDSYEQCALAKAKKWTLTNC